MNKFKGKKAAELRSIIADLEKRATEKLAELKDGLSDAQIRAIEKAHDEVVSDIGLARDALGAAEAADVEARVEMALANEQERRDAIAETGKKLRLSPEFVEQHVRAKTSVAEFRSLAIDEAEKRAGEAGPTTAMIRDGGPAYIAGGRKKEIAPGDNAMRMIAAVALGRKMGVSPIEVAQRHQLGDIVVRSLQASIGSSGGYLIPMELSAEIIELLRPRTVVRKATPQARQISIPRGNLTMGRINQGATIGYVGEGQSTAYSQEVIGDISFNARKAKAIVPVSNDLIRFAQGSADAMVRDDLIRQLAVLEDAAFLRGAGTQWTPKGMRNLADASTVIPATAAFNVTTAIADLTALVNALESAFVPMTNPHWFFSQRTKNFLYDARDSVGGFLFRAEMDRGTFRGYPFCWSQNIPQNLGVGGNASEVYLVDMDEFIIADVPGLMIDASQEASYSPDGSSLVSSFDKDETVIRVIAEHDCNVKHTKAVGVLTGVLWGT